MRIEALDQRQRQRIGIKCGASDQNALHIPERIHDGNHERNPRDIVERSWRDGIDLGQHTIASQQDARFFICIELEAIRRQTRINSQNTFISASNTMN